jgi:hypothetical protein
MPNAAIRHPPMTETIENAKAAASNLFLGQNGEFWDFWLVASVVLAAIAAIAIGITTTGSIVSHKREASASEEALERYKLSAGAVADKLRNDTARLTADNLALQTVLLPRTVGSVGFNGPPKAAEWFAGLERWAGKKLLIQVVPGDLEAQNLANEIAIVVSKFGWRPEFISEARSGSSLNFSEGLSVMSPSSYKSWDPKNEVQKEFGVLRDAAISLAKALTNAGLGVGDYPVSGVNGAMIVVDFPPDSEGEAHNPYRNFSP